VHTPHRRENVSAGVAFEITKRSTGNVLENAWQGTLGETVSRARVERKK
jgi:hypothetical protein